MLSNIEFSIHQAKLTRYALYIKSLSYLKNLFSRSSRDVCNPGTGPIGIEFFREVLPCLRFLSCQPTIPPAPLAATFSNCATLISSCALRCATFYLSPLSLSLPSPFLFSPVEHSRSRRFALSGGSESTPTVGEGRGEKRLETWHAGTNVVSSRTTTTKRFFYRISKIRPNFSGSDLRRKFSIHLFHPVPSSDIFHTLHDEFVYTGIVADCLEFFSRTGSSRNESCLPDKADGVHKHDKQIDCTNLSGSMGYLI